MGKTRRKVGRTVKPLTILAKLDGNYQVELQVQEYHPYEPSAYVWDAGWSCWDPNEDQDYFVSETGSVYLHGSDRVVGVAPEIQEQYALQVQQEEERA